MKKSTKKLQKLKKKEEERSIQAWNKIWEQIYDFQKGIPNELEATKDNAKQLGLMIVYGKHGEKLFINEELSYELFAFRCCH